MIIYIAKFLYFQRLSFWGASSVGIVYTHTAQNARIKFQRGIAGYDGILQIETILG